jgi:trans-aconitate methyltransferase
MSNEFDRFADSYDKTLRASFPAGLDEIEYYASYKIEYLARATTSRKIASILDFGCGAGRSLDFLVRTFPQARVVGYDPSPESIRAAAQRVPKAALSDDWEEIGQQRFDVAFAANVFHHIAREDVSSWLARS